MIKTVSMKFMVFSKVLSGCFVFHVTLRVVGRSIFSYSLPPVGCMARGYFQRQYLCSLLKDEAECLNSENMCYDDNDDERG